MPFLGVVVEMAGDLGQTAIPGWISNPTEGKVAGYLEHAAIPRCLS